ncbi:hypothetical protein [Candidatus Soleaferrea massiliensis]|uniref:hypothetical protein n=1 Tax=Candidatus Soleaferrea massiliensis TaxID=1470354 RepID=UPI00058DF47D|nr:hypothetical protein [Candidatus Soleaferrea massiliensis]
MRIWGIGATWGDKPMLDEFGKKHAVAIGWEEEEAPGLYAMMNQVQIGDIIYVKSFVIKGKVLHIKAVGTVTSTAYSQPPLLGENKKAINVKWLEKPESFKEILHPLSEEEMRYNVYNNTFYEELNPDIIEIIMNLYSK